jgi:hypothetical protein
MRPTCRPVVRPTRGRFDPVVVDGFVGTPIYTDIRVALRIAS